MASTPESIRTARGIVCLAVLVSLVAAFHLGGGHPRGALFVLLMAAFVGATAQAVHERFQTWSVSVAASLLAAFVGFVVITRTLAWMGL